MAWAGRQARLAGKADERNENIRRFMESRLQIGQQGTSTMVPAEAHVIAEVVRKVGIVPMPNGNGLRDVLQAQGFSRRNAQAIINAASQCAPGAAHTAHPDQGMQLALNVVAALGASPGAPQEPLLVEGMATRAGSKRASIHRYVTTRAYAQDQPMAGALIQSKYGVTGATAFNWTFVCHPDTTAQRISTLALMPINWTSSVAGTVDALIELGATVLEPELVGVDAVACATVQLINPHSPWGTAELDRVRQAAGFA